MVIVGSAAAGTRRRGVVVDEGLFPTLMMM